MIKTKVLVVEDDRCGREAMLDLLLSHGFAAVGVSSVAGAIDSLEKHEIDVVLLDVQLPDGNGAEVLRWIRRRDRHVPVAVTTAARGEALGAALSFQPEAVFRKPLDWPEILWFVRTRWLREGEAMTYHRIRL